MVDRTALSGAVLWGVQPSPGLYTTLNKGQRSLQW